MARTQRRDSRGRFAGSGGSGRTPKAPASKAKADYKGKRRNAAKEAAGKSRGPMKGDALFNEMFRGGATRKQRGAKPATEPGKGRYLKMQNQRRSASKEAARRTARSRGGTWLR